MVENADLVVVGTFGKVERGLTWTDEYGNVMYAANVTLDVEQVLRGVVSAKQPGSLRLWVHLGTGDATDDFGWRLSQLQASVPDERGLLFLSNNAEWVRKTGGDPDRPDVDPYGYQPLGGQGYLRDVGGKVVAPVTTASGTWPDALDGEPFDDVVAEVAAMTSSD